MALHGRLGSTSRVHTVVAAQGVSGGPAEVAVYEDLSGEAAEGLAPGHVWEWAETGDEL